MGKAGAVVLAWMGLAVAALGVLVGVIPLSAQGTSCGVAFVGTDDAYIADLGSTLVGGDGNTTRKGSCDTLRSVVRIPAFILIGAGGILAGAGYALRERPQVQV